MYRDYYILLNTWLSTNIQSSKSHQCGELTEKYNYLLPISNILLQHLYKHIKYHNTYFF